MVSDTIFLALTLALREMFRINTYVYLRNYSRWHLAGEISKTWLLASVKWILKKSSIKWIFGKRLRRSEFK